MDGGRDGKISLDEWVANQSGVRANVSKDTFAPLDHDGDGFLTSHEVATAVDECPLGDEPNAPGNQLLGPLD